MADPIQPTVRAARPGDAATIAVFNIRMAWETEKLKLDPSTVERGVLGVFEDERRGHYFVAEAEGMVGACLLVTHEWSDWRNGDLWWIQSVYVAPEHRRRGLFRALYAHVESAASDAGAAGLRLYVDRDNIRAQQAYQSLGMSLSHYIVMERGLG